MNFATFIPIIAIIAGAAIILTWMNHRHEQRLRELDRGRSDDKPLEADNARLRETVAELRDRINVLERIATDPAERTAREIEELR